MHEFDEDLSVVRRSPAAGRRRGGESPAPALLDLQRAVGNRAVGELVAIQRTPVAAADATLRMGMYGPAVRMVQEQLVALHRDGAIMIPPPLAVDGHFYNKTTVALGRYQLHAGLEPDAKAGRETWRGLLQAAGENPDAWVRRGVIGFGANGEDVAELQRLLNTAYQAVEGLCTMLPIRADGTFGMRTAVAVLFLQWATGSRMDAVVGPETRAHLAALAPAGTSTSGTSAGAAAPTAAQRTAEGLGVEPGAGRLVQETVAGGGQPLDLSVRPQMEQRLGHDLSAVRVHTDESASESARAVGARAYTSGDHVVFRQGAFQPGTAEGRATLAHELTHVIQQRSGPVDGTDTGEGLRVSDASDRFERSANAAGHAAAHDQSHADACGAGPGRGLTGRRQVQRDSNDEVDLTWTPSLPEPIGEESPGEAAGAAG